MHTLADVADLQKCLSILRALTALTDLVAWLQPAAEVVMTRTICPFFVFLHLIHQLLSLRL
jgi:hypothetical protein